MTFFYSSKRSYFNDAPYFTRFPHDGKIHVKENQTFVYDFETKDPEGDYKEYSIVGGKDRDFFTIDPIYGKLYFKNAPDFEKPLDDNRNNIYDVTIRIRDEHGASTEKTVWITVKDELETPVNERPNANNDSRTVEFGQMVTVNVLSNDSDPDGDNLSIINVEAPLNGTAEIVNGQIKYTPDAGFVGMDIFEYTISDGNGGTDTAELKITVNEPANTAPNAVNDSDTTEQGQMVTVNVLNNDSDPDGDNLSIINVEAPLNGTAEIVNGQIKYTPDAGFVGMDIFEYTISDGNGGTDTAELKITVNEPANTAPNALNDSDTTEQGQIVTVNVLNNDSDPDGDNLSIINVEDPLNGTAEIVNGQIKYTPDAGFVGMDIFEYTISDGNGGTDTAELKITVNEPANTAPNALNDRDTTEQGQMVTVNVLNNDSDPDGDNLSIINVEAPLNGTAEIVNGQIKYTPDAGFVGMDIFEYTISDGNGGTDTAELKITVNEPANTAPNALNDRDTTEQGQMVTVNVLNNDSDPDGDNLSIINVEAPLNGTAEIVNGQIKYTPDAGFVGMDIFEYTISDGNGGTDTAELKITVTEPADPNTGVIGNEVFLDANENGRNGNDEEGVAGVKVVLTGLGADGVLGTNDDTMAMTRTDTDGLYRFAGLPGGQYQVTFEAPEGFEFTTKDALNNEGNPVDGVDSDANPNTGITDVFVLNPGQTKLNVDAGLIEATPTPTPTPTPNPGTGTGTGELGNRVFIDENGNGIQDPGEVGAQGTRVTLTRPGADGILDTGDDQNNTVIVNNPNGNFLFQNLPGGDYKLTVSNLPDGAIFSPANQGNNEATDSDFGSNGMVRVTLAPGEVNKDVDAGIILTPTPTPGEKNLIKGTAGKDELDGTGGDDDLRGLGDRDTIKGFNGDDCIHGAGGNDKLLGGAGWDTISGGAGKDTIFGGLGDDVLTGGKENDRIYAGKGNDTINGTDDNALGAGEWDVLVGQGGKDLFVLGGANGAYYNSGDVMKGDEVMRDFALVKDFVIGIDRLQLAGSRNDYDFVGNEIYKDGDLVANFIGVQTQDITNASIDFV